MKIDRIALKGILQKDLDELSKEDNVELWEQTYFQKVIDLKIAQKMNGILNCLNYSVAPLEGWLKAINARYNEIIQLETKISNENNKIQIKQNRITIGLVIATIGLIIATVLLFFK